MNLPPKSSLQWLSISKQHLRRVPLTGMRGRAFPSEGSNTTSGDFKTVPFTEPIITSLRHIAKKKSYDFHQKSDHITVQNLLWTYNHEINLVLWSSMWSRNKNPDPAMAKLRGYLISSDLTSTMQKIYLTKNRFTATTFAFILTQNANGSSRSRQTIELPSTRAPQNMHISSLKNLHSFHSIRSLNGAVSDVRILLGNCYRASRQPRSCMADATIDPRIWVLQRGGYACSEPYS